MSLSLLFPGQGSQFVGMAQELATSEPACRRTIDEADEILGFPLSELMAHGPAPVLTETRHAQPAILTHSVAVLRTLGESLGSPSMAAGHSLGEFSAHVAAGTLSFADALTAVRLRGELMFDTGSRRPGAMAAVLGMSGAQVRAALAPVSRGMCIPANYNSDIQVVISGDVEAVEEAMELLPKSGAKRVVRLPVSGAFHSPLMKPAAKGLAEALAGMEFRDPEFPVFSNVTASPVWDGQIARELLVEQLTSSVRWSQSVSAMLQAGATHFAELGPCDVLCGLNRRNARRVPCASLSTPADVEAWRGASLATAGVA